MKWSAAFALVALLVPACGGAGQDGGDAGIITPPPASSDTPQGQLNGVFFASSTRGWIVGEEGRIWRTDDAGDTWTAQHSGVSASLTRVQFVSTTSGWTVGGGGTILKTSDGGGTWAVLNSGSTEFLRGLSFVNASTGWVVGDGDTLLKTSDGGATWARQTSGRVNHWSAVSFITTTQGWVGGSGEILITLDGGATWTAQEAFLDPSGTPRRIVFYDARFSSLTQGTMVGATRAGDILRTTTDGGQTWRTLENTALVNAFNGIAFGDGFHSWAVGSVGKIVASKDTGATWTLQPSPTRQTLLGIWAVDAVTAWAVGMNGTVIRTTDGSTWTLLQGVP